MTVSGPALIFALANVRELALEKGTCFIADTVPSAINHQGRVHLLELPRVLWSIRKKSLGDVVLYSQCSSRSTVVCGLDYRLV